MIIENKYPPMLSIGSGRQTGKARVVSGSVDYLTGRVGEAPQSTRQRTHGLRGGNRFSPTRNLSAPGPEAIVRI